MSDIDINKIRRMDGNLLLVLRELLRLGNATATARRLNLSQSAISHALSRLRELFDDQLFERRPHGLEPTRRALELAPHIEAIVDMLGTTLSGVATFDAKHAVRRFNISAPEFVTTLIGAPLVARVARIAPHVSMHIRFMPHEQAMSALLTGELDLAIGRFGKLQRLGCLVEDLYTDQYCVVARAQHPRLKRAVSLRQYTEVGHIFVGSWSEAEPQESLPDPREVATLAIVPHWLTALTMVSASDAITTCPRRFAEREAKRLKLRVFKAPFHTAPFVVSTVRRQTSREDPAVTWLIERIREAVT